jgi:type VI secretion system protein ImpA
MAGLVEDGRGDRREHPFGRELSNKQDVMLNVDDLLAPVSSEDPCGPDLSYDPALQELEILVQGKPETQFSEAEEPNWKQVREKSLALFARSKDLRVAINLVLVELQEEGFPGFFSGLQLIRRMLEQYWDTLQQRLDHESNNDALERMTLLLHFDGGGTFGDSLQVLRRLRRAPLCHSLRLGTFSLSQIQMTGSSVAAPSEGNQLPATKAPDLALIDAAFRDTDSTFLKQIEQSVGGAVDEVNRISEFLDRTIGVAQSASFDALTSVLLEAGRQVSRYLATPAGAEPEYRLPSGVAETTGSRVGIQTRTDVLQSLDAICAYYESTEPSSPVLPLLRRAQQLVGKNFTEILQELAPDTVAQVKLS